MAPALNDDFELLRLCARMEHDSATIERIRAKAASTIDWYRLIGLAHEHRVLPLVCRTLDGVASDVVPGPALTRLRTLYRSNATRNLSLTAELLRVLDVVAAKNIPCIPYKGPVLASTAYGDVSLRQFADLDVIVPAADIRRALEALITIGYQPQTPDDLHKLTSPTVKDVVLRREGTELELHWGITTDVNHPIQVPSDLVWNTAGKAMFRGRPICTFSPETEVLVHCIHGVSHGWQRMGWLCDVAGIVRSQPRIDWLHLNAMAAESGARRLVYHSLALARTLLDLPLPQSVIRELESDPSLPPLTARVTQWLADQNCSELPVGELQRYYIDVREKTRDKLWVLSRQAKRYLAPTERDAGAFQDGRPGWIVYVRRPFRLAREYGLTPFFRFLKGVFQA
jgi:hypothetical protein